MSEVENSIWGTHPLGDEEPYFLDVGALNLWMQYRNEEIWIAYCYDDELEGKVDSSAPPEKTDWQRWAHKSGGNEVQILPAFADLPLIVHSEYSLKVSPYTTIQIYSRVPLWISISIAKNEYSLIELPAMKLSKTWFGTPIEGELCYHVSTKARRDLSKTMPEGYLLSCPITIANRSAEELTFESFCFRVERLGIYKDTNGVLWADETEITYHGEEQHSDIIMTGKLPKGITKDMQISKPRKQIHKSLATRTFQRFFEDTDILGR